MPQRFLRPGITTSSKWNSLDWFDQSFYIRLLTLVDDAGRYDARPEILRAYCFPLRDDVTRQETAAAGSRLRAAGLLEIYNVDGKEFLQLTNWQERMRNKSKWPEPTAANGSQRQPTAAESCQKLLPSASPSPSPSTASSGDTLAVELPAGFPRSEAEAVLTSGAIGCPPQVAIVVWNAASSRGGRDARDVPIRNWASHLKSCWIYQQERIAKDKRNENSRPNRNQAPDRNAGTYNANLDPHRFDNCKNVIR